ncbi:sigma-70 family RNA polymerase sigma factor [Clostridium tyrobutyricum]|uniref:sigma-70 family RNA polymerase sigma factor n=1 Tax=Clostridium tyrobutyricum TaxID=1519 RepID=UPI001C38CE22|nr:sigma-70 family RNA polymerase sigma factor [Clostridium tyrobutyricum]MBV4417147.1 sigma-70 family RNA polymerase sigma factor [Clostridium tyrobutyricum]
MINAEDNMGLVYKAALKQHKGVGYRHSLEDLVQIGSIGLVKAAKVFDESRGYKFSTIALKYINTEIYNAMRKDSWNFTTARKRFKKDNTPISLNVELKEDENTSYIDLLRSEEDGFNSVDINSLIDTLPVHLKRTINLYYFYGFNQGEISKKEKVSRQAISNHIKRALRLLRKELTA